MGRGDIVVVGSINLDILLFQDRLPLRGETYLATDVRETFGGKGANQAVQCAKLGQRVHFVGAIGPDARGRECRANLERHGVQCHLAQVVRPTGIGVNNVLSNGELHATIVAGANGELTADWVRGSADAFDAATFVIVQNEISAEANSEAIRQARQHGARVVYNAAPADPDAADLLDQSDYLIVNEEEALAYVGNVGGDHDMKEVVGSLRKRCPRVVVTMGAAGAMVSFDDEGVHHVPPVQVRPVDTTGAGDSFVGSFTAALNCGEADLRAARIASGVAANATLAAGAQSTTVGDWGQGQ